MRTARASYGRTRRTPVPLRVHSRSTFEALILSIHACGLPRARRSRPGKLRDPGIRCRHNRAEHTHGRTALELHHPRRKGLRSTESTPTHHAVHETVEITQGITDWSEVGFYVFTSIQHDAGWEWVGDHIRPRVRAPDTWHWPVGVSLRPRSDTSARATRQTHGRGRSGRSSTSRWAGSTGRQSRPRTNPPRSRREPGLALRARGQGGLRLHPGGQRRHRYYGDYGEVANILPLHNQQQQIFLVTDLNVSPKWEINFAWASAPPPRPIAGSSKESWAGGSTGDGSSSKARIREQASGNRKTDSGARGCAWLGSPS